MQTRRTTLCDVRSTRVLPSLLRICGWDTNGVTPTSETLKLISLFFSLAALRLFSLASVYISILHTAVTLISMNNSFDVTHHLSFDECDVSETECALIYTALLLFWTLPTVLRFITRYFGNWSCSTMYIRPSQTPRCARRAHESGDPQTFRILKFVLGYSALESFLVAEGSILNPGYKIWK